MKDTMTKFVRISIIPILLIAGTLAVYFISKGYRFNFSNGHIEQTGVISIKSYPSHADVYLDDEYIGRTPETIGGLDIGEHIISVKKDNYTEWSKTVTLEAGQLLPFTVVMFQTDPEVTQIYPPPPDPEDVERYDGTVDAIYTDSSNTLALFTVIYEDPTLPQERREERLLLFTYPTDRRFWELTVEPREIADLSVTDLDLDLTAAAHPYTISISPDAQKALLHTTHQSDGSTSCYAFDTNIQNESPEELTDLAEYSSVPPTWLNDSQHIVFSKNNELRTLNLQTRTVSVIASKQANESFIWTSNASGQIFLLSKSTDTIDIIRVNPDGSTETTLLTSPQKDAGRALFQSPETIPTLGEEDNDITSSHPLSDAYDIKITPDEDSIFIFTPTNIVQYHINGENTNLFPADNPSFVSFSPSDERFLYTDNNGTTLNEFYLEAEEEDPLHDLGPHSITDLDEALTPANIFWHPHEQNILYSTPGQGNLYNITEVDTENNSTYTFPTSFLSPTFSIDSSGEFLVGFCDNPAAICQIALYD